MRNVSTGSPVKGGAATLDRGWTGRSLQDGLTIGNLRRQNQQLRQVLGQYEFQIRRMRATLDTTEVPALDTGDQTQER